MENILTNTYIGCQKCNTVGTFEVFIRRDGIELKCTVCGKIRVLKTSTEFYIK